MSKIYLLTGAAGLLGCNIARQLVDAKEVVRALVLKDDPAVAYVPDQVQIIYGFMGICLTLIPWKNYLLFQRAVRLL